MTNEVEQLQAIAKAAYDLLSTWHNSWRWLTHCPKGTTAVDPEKLNALDEALSAAGFEHEILT